MKILTKALFMLACCVQLQATNGVFQIGYGMKSKGMGGVGTAYPQEALAGVANPAGMGFIDNRYDVGFILGKFHSRVKIRNNALEHNGKFYSDMNFYLLDAGYNKFLSDNIAAGICLYQKGGETNYGRHIPLYGDNKLFGGLIHAILKPCLAWKINCDHTIGFGINIDLARYRQAGLENFRVISSSPDHVSNKGSNYNLGYGVSIGWLGRLFDNLYAGISYDSPISINHFKRYRGLFPNRGKVLLPQVLSGGLSYKFNCIGFALDVQRIFWSKERLFGNRINADLLGKKNATGLGWKDQTVWKIGLDYHWTDEFVFRMGCNLANNQVPRTQTFANPPLNLMSIDHFTYGATWTFGCHELTLTYIHAFEHEVKGKKSVPAFFGGGEVDLRNSENWIGLAYGHVF